MPYISQDDRKRWTFDEIDEFAKKIHTCGDLNYIFTKLCHKYLENKGLRYQNINDIVGALEGCKLEIYRRVASDYEDEKITENGDVQMLHK